MKEKFMRNKIFIYTLFLLSIFSINVLSQNVHPNLVLTKKDVQLIKANLGKVPLFDASFNEAKEKIDAALQKPIEVPIPKDPGGGYTHEKHKENYNEMYLAGIMYSVTGEEKYAEFIKVMLDKYAKMYPSLPLHPAAKDQSAGKLFWQSLNETVWLFYTIQAYDCIYDWLAPAERTNFENNIFRPMVNFFVEKITEQFDLIHNHGTWMDAAVGMTGYVLHDQNFIDQALYGSKKDSTAGYLKQVQLLFSPDGYYTEGAYYARYALMPFFLFAQAINNNRPDLKIFEYRDQIFKKAFYSAMQLTYTNGAFIPINDALKEKTFRSIEIVYALDITYKEYGQDKNLLGIAKEQNKVMLNGAGLLVAKAINNINEIKPFDWKSEVYSDGPKGKQGGLSILRYGPVYDQECLLFKYTSHGLSHGHYDKLSFLFYDQGREIIQDYGSARFLNVEQKYGGRYLPENKTYAMQTIAHNTLVVDGKSDYNFKRSSSEKYHPDKFYFSANNPNFQVSSATDEHAYEGVKMHRTLVMIKDSLSQKPFIVDVFKIKSDKEHQYDLPFYYLGHLIATNFKYTPFTNKLTPLGTKNGYQHLWKVAEAIGVGSSSITWLNGDRYYSITTNAHSSTQIFLTRIGANDPDFNLRNDPGFMLRTKAKNHVFASIIEPHGEFNPTAEFSVKSYSHFKSINVLASNDEGTIVEIKKVNNGKWILMIANKSADENVNHSINVAGKIYKWVGPIQLQNPN